MSKKKKRSRDEAIAHLERSIKRFGDPDGSRAAELKRLKAQRKEP